MEKNITYKNANCFYKVTGSGNALVLLHGFCEDANMWDDFKQPFLESHQIITPDFPGFHRSEMPNTAISMEAYADFVKTILDELKIDKAIVVGHSMGGYVALALAEQHPDVIVKLSLFHSHPFNDDQEKQLNRKKTVTFIKKHGTEPFLRQFYPNLFAKAFAKQNTILTDKLIERGLSYKSDTIIAALEAMMNRKGRSSVLKNLTVPVLFIIGKQDSGILFSLSLSQTHLAPVSDVNILENVGHMGMYEAKKQCQQILHNFIALKH